jgi:hypothetical protein
MYQRVLTAEAIMEDKSRRPIRKREETRVLSGLVTRTIIVPRRTGIAQITTAPNIPETLTKSDPLTREEREEKRGRLRPMTK